MKTGYKEIDDISAGPLDNAINILLCDNPYGKTVFISKIITEILKGNNCVYYIDLDTSFTVYLQANLFHILNLEKLSVYHPNKFNLDNIISYLCSLNKKEGGVIILDSVSSIYHIFASEQKASNINLRLGLYLAFLQKFAVENKFSILITSMARSKKANQTSWVQTYSGGRVLMNKSEVIYKTIQKQKNLQVEVIRHRKSEIKNRVINISL